MDDFVLIAPPHLEEQVWERLDNVIDFKEPAVPVERCLGVYHKTSVLSDATVEMVTEGEAYLVAAVMALSPFPSLPHLISMTHSMKILPSQALKQALLLPFLCPYFTWPDLLGPIC